MLMGALYHKTLKLKERDSNASELTSLMTSDVDGVAEFFGHYYHTRVNIIEISLHLVLLMYLTGVLSILVLVPVFGKILCSSVLEIAKRANMMSQSRGICPSSSPAQHLLPDSDGATTLTHVSLLHPTF